MTRVACISDTHGWHRSLTLPDADLLIHAGDFSRYGTIEELEDFNDWLGTIKHRYALGVCLIAGNHDRQLYEQGGRSRALITNATYMEDSGVTLANGLKVWGSPWTPMFQRWSFMLDTEEELAKRWAMIPDNTDILVTHGPAWGGLDLTSSGEHVGSRSLAEKVRSLALGARRDPEKPNLKLSVVGHIHEQHGGPYYYLGVQCVNASTCTIDYAPTNPPIVVTL